MNTQAIILKIKTVLSQKKKREVFLPVNRDWMILLFVSLLVFVVIIIFSITTFFSAQTIGKEASASVSKKGVDKQSITNTANLYRERKDMYNNILSSPPDFVDPSR